MNIRRACSNIPKSAKTRLKTDMSCMHQRRDREASAAARSNRTLLPSRSDSEGLLGQSVTCVLSLPRSILREQWMAHHLAPLLYECPAVPHPHSSLLMTPPRCLRTPQLCSRTSSFRRLLAPGTHVLYSCIVSCIVEVTVLLQIDRQERALHVFHRGYCDPHAFRTRAGCTLNPRLDGLVGFQLACIIFTVTCCASAADWSAVEPVA